MDSQTPSSTEEALDQSPQPIGPGPVGLSLSDKAAKLIANASAIFFGLFALIVIFDAMPPRLLDPLWLIGLAVSLTNTVSFPLVGLILVHIGAALAPMNAGINQRRMLLSRLAAWASAAYLMLIPLVGFAVWRGVANIGLGAKRQEASIGRSADRLLTAIAKSSTPQQLQQSMASLQGPPISDADLARPLPELKVALRQVVGQIRQRLITEIPRPDAKGYISLYLQALRAALMAFLSSAGFAALSWNAFKESTLLGILFAPKSPDSSSIERLRRRLGARWSAFRNRQKLESSTAERRSFWSSIKNREQMTASKREKDLKRHAKRMRQMQVEREKQMRKNKGKP
jgi:hypothetical protein